MAMTDDWDVVEIWRDDPGDSGGEVEFADVGEGEAKLAPMHGSQMTSARL